MKIRPEKASDLVWEKIRYLADLEREEFDKARSCELYEDAFKHYSESQKCAYASKILHEILDDMMKLREA